MRTILYRNGDSNKYIEVRRYADGHYAYRAFITYFIPEFGRNYLGCKNAHRGEWHRCRKGFLEDVIDSRYQKVDEAVYIKIDGSVVRA